MLGASVTVAYGLATGFDRTAARAQLPDVLATFQPEPRGDVARVVSSLANIRAASYRIQAGHVYLTARDRYEDDATVVGLAREWHLRPGSRLDVGGDEVRVVGVAVAPDNVSFPLSRGPRVWLGYREAVSVTGMPFGTVNSAQLWLVDPSLVEVTLAQARSASLGVVGLRVTTRAGLEVLIGQAAGIVIALLVAFSLIALVVAGTMLAASANAEVQRRLHGLGLLRALGAAPQTVVASAVVEAVAVALPAGAVGVVAGWAAVVSPLDRVLASLSQLGPGASVAPLLAGILVALVA